MVCYKLERQVGEFVHPEVLETIKALEPMTEALLALPLKLSLGQKHMFLHSVLGLGCVRLETPAHPPSFEPSGTVH
eukprot:1289764-Amphidinium_carterae.1